MSDQHSGGLLNFNKSYKFIKDIVREIMDGEPAPESKVPYASVYGENDITDPEGKVTTKNFKQSGNKKNIKPSSMHFISVPASKEVVPLFNYSDEQYYGPPLPIFDSLVNSSQTVPVSTRTFRPNLQINPIQLTPGDVVVQGRYGHAMTFSDANFRGKPTIRISNNHRSRGYDEMKVFNADVPVLEDATNVSPRVPIFPDPNVDGSSIYLLSGGTSPNIDLESELVLARNDRFNKYHDNVLNSRGDTDGEIKTPAFFHKDVTVEDSLLLSSDSIFLYTKGLNNNGGKDISMLASGNVKINSYNNIVLTVPEVKYPDAVDKTYSGTIRLGSNASISDLANGEMQPAIRGNSYKQTITDILDLLELLSDNLASLAGGGIAVDKNGNSIEGGFDVMKKLLDGNIQSVRKKLDLDLAKKVYVS
jgi:hypothetical protein|tara:strand:+ start:2136 stop:3392 length:1257 start_codon:yes stop_codon:yes gene_type:complete